MPMRPTGLVDGTSAGRRRLQIQDLLAFVIGFGLAGILFRAFWPLAEVSWVLRGCGAVFYLWLGLAMSGPLVLLVHPPHREASPDAARLHVGRRSQGRTWAEIAWLLIGTYWIVLGAFVIPGKVHVFRAEDTILFGLTPIAAALILRRFGPRARKSEWTHRLAVALLTTWPVAWLDLILIGKMLL